MNRKKLFRAFVFAGIYALLSCAPEQNQKTQNQKTEKQTVLKTGTRDCNAPLNVEMTNIEGENISLCDYKGKVILAVNTASFCGYTPQYEQLESLYQKYRSRGFVVLGFPANEFGEQEPGSNEDIKSFCTEKYKVTFPMFEKSVVKGNNANALYKQLIQTTGEQPLWNFHKYLIDREGKVISYKSAVRPFAKPLVQKLEQIL